MNYKNKYKTRDPLKTVRIIQDFFKKEGFSIKIVNNQCSESGTWYCHLHLIKNDFIFLIGNGKGINEKYSLASGHAELYERYCNRCPNAINTFYNKNYIEQNKQINNYYFSPDEKSISQQDILNIPLFESYFSSFSKDDNIKKEILNQITNWDPIGVPYSSLNDLNEKIYLDPRILIHINGSQGMAAGNSIEEAFIQANCELYEKYVSYVFFLKSFEQYHLIDLKLITNKVLKQKIQNITKLGYNFYIVDLSYNFNMPVLMSILINPLDGQIFTNFGSFPVFEIALERIITELYQGIFSYKELNIDIIDPFLNDEKYYIMTKQSSGNIHNFFPENFFNKIIYTECNKEVFFLKNTSLKKLINYCKTINKKQKLKIYYRDNSLDKNMAAIHLFCPTLDLNYHIKKVTENTFNNIDFNHIKEITFYFENILEEIKQDKYNYINFVLLLKMMKEYPLEFNCFYRLNSDPFNIGFQSKFLNNLSILVDETLNLENKLQFFKSFYNYNDYKKFLILDKYITTNKYSIDFLMQYLNNIFYLNITNEDIKNYSKGEYLIKKIFYEPIKNYYKGVYLS